MKTIFNVLFVSTLMVFFFSQSFAQTTEKATSDNPTTATSAQGKFVDKNNDGVCDHRDAKGEMSKCANFIDKDGNGVCDNCNKTGDCCKKANGEGMGCQQKHGCGQGEAGCGGHNKGQGNCCPGKQGTPGAKPSGTAEPKK